MCIVRSFGIIGGDKRQIYLARSLSDQGYSVLATGFERAGDTVSCSIDEVIGRSDAVIFPLPCVAEDKSVNAPFADNKIFLSDSVIDVLCKKLVFAGMSGRLVSAYPKLKSARIYDYAARDDFAVRNAVPTAEGALELAMREYDGAVFGSRSLVTGFGRIGKVLARRLLSLGSEVTVCARKPSDLAFIESMGCHAVCYADFKTAHDYDLIFNTVPALIFDRALLDNTDRTALLIDLASLPGGIDLEYARGLGMNAHRALGLPGKCAPKSAGEIIKKTVLSIIEEVNR